MQHRSLPARIRVRSFISFAALSLALGAVTMSGAAADAQTTPTPAPAASPAGTPGTNPAPPAAPSNVGAPAPAQKPSSSQGVGHMPIIDVVPIFTQPAFYNRADQIKDYDPLDVGGTVKIPLTKVFSASFDRSVEATVNQPLERQIVNGVAVYPKVSRDAVLVYRADAQLKQLLVETGLSFRHRIFASGANTVSDRPFPTTYGSQEHHFGYLGLTYTTKPLAELYGTTFAFNLTGDTQAVDHHVGALCTATLVAKGTCAAAGTIYYIDEAPGRDRWYETTQSVAMTIPVDRKNGVAFTAKDTWGYLNLYENAPTPARYSAAVALQLSKKFSNFFSLTMRTQNLHQSYPNNQLHVGSIDILADFHFDFNHPNPTR